MHSFRSIQPTVRRTVLACLGVSILHGVAPAQIATTLQSPVAKAIVDHATGDALRASTVPTLGRLYPLSQAFYVSPGGFVGIGTTDPGAPLDVQGAAALGLNHAVGSLGFAAANLGGVSSTASGTYATTVGGAFNTATASGATALGGLTNTASGGYSVALGGFANVASGLYSMAAGRNARALHDNAIVFSCGDPAGVASTAASQFLVDAPGGMGLNTDAPQAALHVAGGVDAGPTGGGYVVVGRTAFSNIAIDDNEIMARYAGRGSSLFINNDGGDVLFAGQSAGRVGIGTNSPTERLQVAGNVRCTNVIQTSDARLKEDVEELGDALAAILALRGVSYTWNDAALDAEDPGRHLGFLAQEVRGVLPEAVYETDDGTLGVNYAAIVPVLVEALQAQEERLAALERAVAELR